MKLQPISSEDFKSRVKREADNSILDFMEYFQPFINHADSFAVGPYFWLIADQTKMSWIAASPNIRQHTPFTAKEWSNKNMVDIFFTNIHPEDQDFVMAAGAMSLHLTETNPRPTAVQLRATIYCRMLDANNDYRWVLIQIPGNYRDDDFRLISSFVQISDLSHLQVKLSKMMTIFDPINKEHQYFEAVVESQKLIPIYLPNITKRENEVIQLMAKGLNTPQIAEKLFISYSTVENHKKNLRKKTNTKTSAELINFIWSNYLIEGWA